MLLPKEKFDIYMKQSLSAIAGKRPSGKPSYRSVNFPAVNFTSLFEYCSGDDAVAAETRGGPKESGGKFTDSSEVNGSEVNAAN